jgi:hypothetical protein
MMKFAKIKLGIYKTDVFGCPMKRVGEIQYAHINGMQEFLSSKGEVEDMEDTFESDYNNRIEITYGSEEGNNT